MRQEGGTEALSTVVRMLPNVKLVSLIWQHTQSDQHGSTKRSQVILQCSVVHICVSVIINITALTYYVRVIIKADNS